MIIFFLLFLLSDPSVEEPMETEATTEEDAHDNTGDVAADEGAVGANEPAVDETAEAVRRRGSAPTLLESSGGLLLGTARAYATTGVDFLAVGALTHSVPALDLGLDLRAA